MFLSVDPLASKYPAFSPYNYVLNNPMRLIDPTGMGPEDYEDDEDKIPTLSKIQNWFSSTIGNIFSSTEQAATNLPEFVADGTVNAAKSSVETAKDVAEKGVQMTAIVADGTSDASTVVAIGGILAAPFTEGASLGLTATALKVGIYSDGISTLAKTTDALAFDGSTEAAVDQGLKTAFTIGSGALFKSMVGQLVTRTGSAVMGPAFRSAQTGRFVTNAYGFTATAVTDATSVYVASKLNPWSH